MIFRRFWFVLSIVSLIGLTAECARTDPSWKGIAWVALGCLSVAWAWNDVEDAEWERWGCHENDTEEPGE